MKRRQWPIVIWFLALVLFAFVIAKTRFTADLSAFLPRTPTNSQQLLVAQLRDGSVSKTVLVAISGASAQERAQTSRTLATRLRADAAFVSVLNGDPDAAQRARDQTFLFDHRYLLSPAINPDRFTLVGLRHALDVELIQLASSAGLALKPLFTRDPTGETLQVLDLLGQHAQPAFAHGVWASHDGREAILLVQLHALGSDTDAQENALARLDAAFDHVRATPAMRLEVTGPPVFAVRTRATIRRQVTILSILSASLVTLILWLAYRSPLALALGLLPVVTGAMAGVAAVSAAYGTVHGVTLGFGTTLIGEAVDYSIYLFVQVGQNAPFSHTGSSPHLAPRMQTWLATAWPIVRLGMLTSVCGFLSLVFSGFPGLAQLGVYSIAGLLAAGAVTRWVLPTLLPKSFTITTRPTLGAPLATLVEKRAAWRAPVIILLGVAVVYLGIHHAHLWSSSLSALSPISAADQARDASLRAELGAPDVRYFAVASAATAEAALEATEALTPTLEGLVASGVIAGYDAPTRYLPSLATQRLRQAALPDPEVLRQRLCQATRGVTSCERLLPFIEDVGNARSARLLTPTDLAGTSMGLAFGAMFLCSEKGCDALLPLHPAKASGPGIDAHGLRAALARVKTSATIEFVDFKAQSDQLYASYRLQASLLSLAGLVAIMALLAIALRSLGRMVAVLAPLCAAVIVTAFGLVVWHGELTLLHLVGMLLIVAIGSNYALFFDNIQVHRDEPLDVGTLASLSFANLATVMGFGVLAFSSVPLLSDLGETVGPGAILALVFSAVFSHRRAKATSE